MGFTGSVGFTGSQGITGFTGSQGITGFTGSEGVGFTGSQGAGFTGSQGITGFTGSVGFTGSQGAGFTGSQGITGFTGSQGVGGGGEVVTSVSTDTTLAAPNTFYLASGTITLTLPTAIGNSGLKFFIKNNGNGIITTIPQVGQLINNDINIIMTERNSVIGLISDGTGWNIF